MKTIKIGNRVIFSIDGNESELSLSSSDVEMDIRAKEAVKSAIHRSKICGKPIAKYDVEEKRAYIEDSDGVRKYV